MIRDKISHYVPLNRVAPEGKSVICKEMQDEKVQQDRCKFHDEIGRFVVDFFDESFSQENNP